MIAQCFRPDFFEARSLNRRKRGKNHNQTHDQTTDRKNSSNPSFHSASFLDFKEQNTSKPIIAIKNEARSVSLFAHRYPSDQIRIADQSSASLPSIGHEVNESLASKNQPRKDHHCFHNPPNPFWLYQHSPQPLQAHLFHPHRSLFKLSQVFIKSSSHPNTHFCR